MSKNLTYLRLFLDDSKKTVDDHFFNCTWGHVLNSIRAFSPVYNRALDIVFDNNLIPPGVNNYFVLIELFNEVLIQKEIAEKLNIRKGCVSKLVKKAKLKGHIKQV